MAWSRSRSYLFSLSLGSGLDGKSLGLSSENLGLGVGLGLHDLSVSVCLGDLLQPILFGFGRSANGRVEFAFAPLDLLLLEGQRTHEAGFIVGDEQSYCLPW